MRVHAMSRQSVATYTPWGGNEICVSITDPVDPYYGVDEADPADLSDGFDDVLRLQFHDLDDTLINPEMPREKASEIRGLLMTEDHARQIAEFVGRWRHVQWPDAVVAHCEAGVSRSVGCARAISEWMGADKASSRAMHGRGNLWVRRKVLEALEAPR